MVIEGIVALLWFIVIMIFITIVITLVIVFSPILLLIWWIATKID